MSNERKYIPDLPKTWIFDCDQNTIHEQDYVNNWTWDRNTKNWNKWVRDANRQETYPYYKPYYKPQPQKQPTPTNPFAASPVISWKDFFKPGKLYQHLATQEILMFVEWGKEVTTKNNTIAVFLSGNEKVYKIVNMLFSDPKLEFKEIEKENEKAEK